MQAEEPSYRWGRVFAWLSFSIGWMAIGTAGAGVFLQESSLMVLFSLLMGLGGVAFGGGTLLRAQHPYAAPIGALLSGVFNIAAVIILVLYILNER